ncbi:MAG: exosortase-associated protein EpsI, B-type [Burkholderiales bacterium]
MMLTGEISSIMPSNKIAVGIAALMFAASLGAVALRPGAKAADAGPVTVLDQMVPKQFGEWREQTLSVAQMVNPETKELLDKLYSQILTRTYVNDRGYRIMLSLAYGSDQRGDLQAHKPEICYPAQGFTLKSNEPGTLATNFGGIPVRRLDTFLGSRQEPVTYWFTFGDKAVGGTAAGVYKRMVQMRYALSGQIPDGLLFRVSSIDPDPSGAYRVHDQFVDEMLKAIPPADRHRLSGLGKS